MLQSKIMNLIAENKSMEALDVLIDFFESDKVSLAKDFVQLKAQIHQIEQDKSRLLLEGVEYRTVHNKIRNAILEILPADEQVFKIEHRLLETLNRNKIYCLNTGTYFYTIFSLISALQVPDGVLYKIIELYEFNTFDRFYNILKTYIDTNIVNNPKKQIFKEFAWHEREEFKNAMAICMQEKDSIIDDRKLFLGITAGSSTTRDLVSRFFDIEKLKNLVYSHNLYNTP